jgi:hypothetical protein
MVSMQRWCRVTVVGPDGAVVACRVFEGPGVPDLAAVDAVARLALLSVRIGGRFGVTEVSPAMSELLELAGLGVEMER